MVETTEKTGPLYQRLAEKIESDIDSGILAQGDKLPPQRELAEDTGTTIGTVGRAYSLLRQKGLVSGEVGRGTYVLAKKDLLLSSFYKESSPFHSLPPGKQKEKIYFNKTGAPNIGQKEIIESVFSEKKQFSLSDVLMKESDSVPKTWKEAGSLWLSRHSFHAAPDTIIPFSGTQACLTTIIAGLTSPGDSVVFETLTHSAVARSTRMLGRHVCLVHSDEQGIDPEHFKAVCITHKPKLIFLMPSVQNPRAITLPEDRRIKIAQIACDHDVAILEDDTYAHLVQSSLPLMAEIAPERTVVVAGLSKSVDSSLDTGWISCPLFWHRRLHAAYTLMTAGIPFPAMDLAARLVLSKQATKIQEACALEIHRRLDMTQEILSSFSLNICYDSPFVWLSLPEPWLSGTFRSALHDNDLLVDDSDSFRAARSQNSFDAIRFSVSSPSNLQAVRSGLGIIRRVLEEGYAGYLHSD